jgi:hypothetical protein
VKRPILSVLLVLAGMLIGVPCGILLKTGARSSDVYLLSPIQYEVAVDETEPPKYRWVVRFMRRLTPVEIETQSEAERDGLTAHIERQIGIRGGSR